MEEPLHNISDGPVEEKNTGLHRGMPRGFKATGQRIPFAVLVFLLILTGCVHRMKTASMPAGPMDLEEGLIAYEEKEYTKALEHFENALKRDPQNVEAHFRRGVIFQRQNKTDQAVAAYREAIRIDPNHYKTHYNLGNLYSYEKANDVQAIYHYRRFLALVPTHPLRHQVQARLTALTDVGEEGTHGKVITEGLEDPDDIYLTHEIAVPPPPVAPTLPPSPPHLPTLELPTVAALALPPPSPLTWP